MLSRALTTSQTVAGPMVFSAAQTFSSTINVSGLATLSTVNVTSTATFATINLTGAATFGTTLGVTGAVNLSSTLAVGGASTFTGAATFNGAVTVQTPSASANPTTKTYVDTADALKLNLAGGTMSGNLTIQNTSPTVVMADTDNGTFQVHCNSGLIGFLGTSGGWISRTDNSGNFVATGNVTAYSDAKLKENVKTIQNAVDLVNQMRGVYYDRIDTGEAGVGVIAQEIRDIVPEVVKENDGTLSVAYGNLVGVLIEAIKELSNKIELMESR
jgi:hypothetical protein